MKFVPEYAPIDWSKAVRNTEPNSLEDYYADLADNPENWY